MSKLNIHVSVLISLIFGCGGALAQDQPERTGSRLGAGASDVAVVRFSEPYEVRHVLELIEQGKFDEAVEFAEAYLESLASVVEAGGSSAARQRYYALNAVCIARTKAGKIDAAIEACTEAIDVLPTTWLAINSRGTAYYSSRRFELALNDYRRALEVAPKNDERVIATIEQNIRLTEGRLAERGAPN